MVALFSSGPIEGGNGTLRAAYDSSVRLAVAPPKAQQAKSWAYSDFGKAGTVVSVGKPDLLGATTYTFANGVKLTVKQVDFNKNSISIGLLNGIGERNFRSEEHTSELQSLMRNSYTVFCSKK